MSSRALLFVAVFGLAGCGGGGGGGGGGNEQQSAPSPQTLISIALTDAPVDSALEVVVSFSGVALKPVNGQEQVFEFETARAIDLLTLQGNASTPLLEDQVIEPGSYEWIRLAVNAAEGVRDSYMIASDGTEIELRIPSGAQTGLKLVEGFNVAQGSSADFTIDFDVRKSITNPPGLAEAILKPTLRLVDNLEIGTINGSVAPEIISEACADATVFAGAVYLFSGTDVIATDLGQVDGEDNPIDPFTTALVSFEENNEGIASYRYEFGFIPAGPYSLAMTCSDDEPELDERERYASQTLDPAPEEGENIVVFYANGANSFNVTVEAGATTTQNFENPAQP